MQQNGQAIDSRLLLCSPCRTWDQQQKQQQEQGNETVVRDMDSCSSLLMTRILLLGDEIRLPAGGAFCLSPAGSHARSERDVSVFDGHLVLPLLTRVSQAFDGTDSPHPTQDLISPILLTCCSYRLINSTPDSPFTTSMTRRESFTLKNRCLLWLRQSLEEDPLSPLFFFKANAPSNALGRRREKEGSTTVHVLLRDPEDRVPDSDMSSHPHALPADFPLTSSFFSCA